MMIFLLSLLALVVLTAAGVLALYLGRNTDRGRRILMWIATRPLMQKMAARALRARARREGTATDAMGREKSDVELMLDEAGGDEAAQVKQMLASLPPAQRRQALRQMDRMMKSGEAMESSAPVVMNREQRRAAKKKGMSL